VKDSDHAIPGVCSLSFSSPCQSTPKLARLYSTALSECAYLATLKNEPNRWHPVEQSKMVVLAISVLSILIKFLFLHNDVAPLRVYSDNGHICVSLFCVMAAVLHSKFRKGSQKCPLLFFFSAYSNKNGCLSKKLGNGAKNKLR
jgi:hypothetical protein